MTTPDPITDALDAIAAAREHLDDVRLAMEDLQDADQSYVTARIRPHFDMWRARIAYVERQRLANELTALRMERDAAHEECARVAAERDHARAIAVALVQGLTVDTRVPMDSDRTPEVEG